MLGDMSNEKTKLDLICITAGVDAAGKGLSAFKRK
jgi:hypothetical protein